MVWSFRQNTFPGCYPVFPAISSGDEVIVDTRSGVTAGKLLGRKDMITLACSGKASIKDVTFVTIGLTIHDSFCRKPSADIPVRAHRVSSLSLGVQLTVSLPHQPRSWVSVW